MLPPPPPSAISETSTLRSHDSTVISPAVNPRSEITPPPPSTRQSSDESTKEPENPWLAGMSTSTKVPRRKNELVSGRNLTRIEKSEIQVQKQLSKGSEARGKQLDDSIIELDVDNVLHHAEKSPEKPSAVNGASQTMSKKQRKKEANVASFALDMSILSYSNTKDPKFENIITRNKPKKGFRGP